MILIARSALMKISKMMIREMYLTFLRMRKIGKLIFFCDIVEMYWKSVKYHLSFSTRDCLFLAIKPQYGDFVIWKILCNFFFPHDAFSKNITCPSLTATFVVVMQFVSAESKKKKLHCFVYKFNLLARAAFVFFYENQIWNLSKQTWLAKINSREKLRKF